MFKVRCRKNFPNDVWNLDIGGVYNCEIENDVYIVHILWIMTDGNTCTINITWNKEDFNKRFTNIREDRKLKLEKINNV